MSTAKTIAGVIPGVMSLGLVGESLKMLPTEKDIKTENISPKKMIKGATTMLVGIPLIGATAGMVNKL